jgi:hypothetical protein
MIVNFRHGVVSGAKNGSNQPAFLQVSGANIGINATNTPLVLTVAHLDSNYLVSVEQSNAAAWTGINAGTTTYLYVDIDLKTAVVTYGTSTLAPITQGARPATAVNGQDWFDTANGTMRSRINGVWIEVARIYVASVSGASFTYQPFGSQINVSGGEYPAGKIAFDLSGKPISKATGEFFTTEDAFYVNGVISAPNAFGTHLEVVTAAEAITPYSVVRYNAFESVRLARYEDTDNTGMGIAMAGANPGERLSILPNGIVKNAAWNFPLVNASVWVDVNGQITTTDPVLASSGRGHQPPVGRVIATDTIIFNPLQNGVVVTDPTMIGPMGPQGADGIAGPASTVPGPQGPVGPAGPVGPQGTGLTVKGSLTSASDLPVSGTTGDGYLINGELYVWTGSTWNNVGSIQGPAGAQGPAGTQGPAGPAGAQGPAGTQGPAGPAGAQGATGNTGGFGPSAYQLAVTNGFVGTEAAWLASLNGPAGAQGPAGTQGPAGAQGPAGTQGPAGAQGPAGTQGVAGQTGPQGVPGQSVAVKSAGTALTAAATSINFTGTGVTTTTVGADVTVNLTGGTSYTLPAATASTLGGIKVGTGLSVDGTGLLTATATTYTLPAASASVLGGVKQGTGVTIAGDGTISASTSYTLPTASTTVSGGVKVDGTTITINGSGVISAASYTLPTAAAATLGGIKIGTGLAIDGAGVVSVTASGVTNLTNTPAATTVALGSSSGTGTVLPAATTTLAGVMVAADKAKLDGIAASANNYVLPTASTTVSGGVKVDGTTVTINGSGVISAVAAASATNLTNAAAATTVVINSSTGTGTTLAAATVSAAGVMVAADKAKLDGIATGANNYSLPIATTSVLGGVKAGTNITIAADGTISSTASGGGGTSGTYVSRSVSFVNNGVTAWFNVWAYGTQAQLNSATISAAGGTSVTVSNVPAGLQLISFMMAIPSNYNSTTAFAFIYPDPFGATTTLNMMFPAMTTYNELDVLQNTANVNVTNTSGVVQIQRTGLTANVGYKFKIVL